MRNERRRQSTSTAKFKAVHLADSLPITADGEPDKKALRARWADKAHKEPAR